MTSMDLSIVIVNFNNPHLLDMCLSSIARSKPSMRYEVIVVDNASSYDVSSQIASHKKQLHNLKLIKKTTNTGFGRANNRGVKAATGTYVLFLNTDIEVIDGAINTLYDYTVKQKSDCIVGGKLVNPDMSDQPSAGPFFSLPVVFAMLFLKGDSIGLSRYSPQTSRPVDWVSGACFMMRRDVFLKTGGFDERIFMYMEELDIMYRARLQGTRTLFCSESLFIHLGAATSKNRTTPIINIFKGLTYIYSKHYSSLHQQILVYMLKTKAQISIILGKIMGDRELVERYEEAMNVVSG